MIISHRYRFIFIKTLKTAGTSIEVYLSRILGDGDVVTPIDPPVEGHRARNFRGLFDPLPELWADRGRGVRATLRNLGAGVRFHNHLPAYRARARLPRGVWDDYFKFCVDRNPWDKCLSHFHMIRRRDEPHLTLDRYLERGRLCWNLPFYTEPGDGTRVLVDRVLRYERLDQELSDVFGDLGVPFPGTLEVSAKSGYRSDRRPYREVLTAAQREIIARAFDREIRMHRYAF